MSVGDMPRITDSAHTHTIYSPSNMAQPIGIFGQGFASGLLASTAVMPDARGRVVAQMPASTLDMIVDKHFPKQEKPMTATRRLVQVFIADPDENVPLEKSLLYSGEQKLTDLNDQELFFEVDIKTILDKHNTERVTLINRKVKERTENLEPVKIRDLRMVVVVVASF